MKKLITLAVVLAALSTGAHAGDAYNGFKFTAEETQICEQSVNRTVISQLRNQFDESMVAVLSAPLLRNTKKACYDAFYDFAAGKNSVSDADLVAASKKLKATAAAGEKNPSDDAIMNTAEDFIRFKSMSIYKTVYDLKNQGQIK